MSRQSNMSLTMRNALLSILSLSLEIWHARFRFRCCLGMLGRMQLQGTTKRFRPGLVSTRQKNCILLPATGAEHAIFSLPIHPTWPKPLFVLPCSLQREWRSWLVKTVSRFFSLATPSVGRLLLGHVACFLGCMVAMASNLPGIKQDKNRNYLVVFRFVLQRLRVT